MIRIEVYTMMDGLMLHVAASNLRDESTLAGGSGMSVHRVIASSAVEEKGVDDVLLLELMSVFRLYPGLAHYALR